MSRFAAADLSVSRSARASGVQGHSKTSHRPGTATRVVLAEAPDYKPDSWSLRLWASGANRKLCLNCAYRALQSLNDLVRVGPVGLEPTTYGLKVRSSAN